MDAQPKIVVVDDTPANIRLLEAVLTPRNYTVLSATSGREALDLISRERPDLILLDILMPEMDGYEVCTRLRSLPETSMLPIIMITASGAQEKIKALEAGADDFIAKPFDKAELLARVRSLLRVKQYHDVIQVQTTELAELNQSLEVRVQEQVTELQRMGRLRRFLSPQIADAIAASGDEGILRTHRREIAVLFCDLRGFIPFSETAEPEEMMEVLHEYHDGMGALITEAGATVGFFERDGLMVFFNDPFECPEPAVLAVRLAIAMKNHMDDLLRSWRKRGHELGFGVGIDFGYATLGEIGFESRRDYGVIGTVVNMASRISGGALNGQILLSQRAHAAAEGEFTFEDAGELTVKGIARPVTVYNVLGEKADAEPASVTGTMVLDTAGPASFGGGRYSVQRVLGEGGQKLVYLVHDTSLGRECALSVLKTELTEPDDLARIRREAQAMASLKAHTNIVTVYDLGDEDGRPYIVCEYVPRGDLQSELRSAAGPLPLLRALSITADVCRALAVAHARGIVHRDVKAANIWLSEDGSAKLGDFGIASTAGASRLTMTGTVVGSASNMSPEQAQGEPLDARSDLYAVGCLLYELVAGQPPFVGREALAIVSQHIHKAPSSPRSHNRELPKAADALIMRLLAKDRQERPESAAAVVAELSQIAAGLPQV